MKKIVLLLLILFFSAPGLYALELDTLRGYLISRDYKSAIAEGEKILAQAGKTSGIDEVYYILGLSYMKDGNYLRASDIFEIIITEFKNSAFIPEAKLGLGDTYYFRGNVDRAGKEYESLLGDRQAHKLKSALYYRLSQCAAKSGNEQVSKEYLEKLKKEFPLNLESGLEKSVTENPAVNTGGTYTVQVGSFSSTTNASNLLRELTQKGYAAYIEKPDATGKQIYRVKVGKLRVRQEAEQLGNKLSQQGYPTKVCP
jgi:tetratricopeptide (TPR) repeat protein